MIVKFTGPSLQFTRWSIKVLKYDFTVEHRLNLEVPHTDALLRHVNLVSDESTLTKKGN